MTYTVIASLGRIADLEDKPYDVAAIDQAEWETGDYVVGEVTGTPTELYNIENCDGEMIPVLPGNHVIGALGVRAATLEGVGSWRDVKLGKMEALTNAGLFGVFTSISRFLPDPISLDYVGHIQREGDKVRMRDFALECQDYDFDVPVIMLIGTSMSAGKTLTGTLVCEVLSEAGLRVIGAKITGAGRYKDIISFRNAGAVEIYDFVDVGLPSTVVDEQVFRDAIRPLLCHIASRQPDYVVVEAGASPLEPYNGDAAVDMLRKSLVCKIVCASDPYAVVGVQKAFRFKPDLITGPATNTSAAIDLVDKLTGVPAINILEAGAMPEMRKFLSAKLGRDLSAAD